MKAVEESGFKPTGHSLALNSYENRVFDLKLEDVFAMIRGIRLFVRNAENDPC